MSIDHERRALFGVVAATLAGASIGTPDANAVESQSKNAVKETPLARIPLQTPQSMPELFEFLEQRRPGAAKTTIFPALANCPEILRAFIEMADRIREGNGIDPELREMAIVMTCQTIGSRYEHSRHWNSALHSGVPKAKLEKLWDCEDSEMFSPLEKTVLRLARNASRAPAQVSETDWEDVRSALGDQKALALLFSIGWYNMTGRLTGALDMKDEPGFVRL